MDEFSKKLQRGAGGWGLWVISHLRNFIANFVIPLVRYYGELTRRQVESLVEIFHLDLLLFGYSAQVTPYLKTPYVALNSYSI